MIVLPTKMPLPIRGIPESGTVEDPVLGHDMRRCGIRKGIFIIVGVPRAGHGNSSRTV